MARNIQRHPTRPTAKFGTRAAYGESVHYRFLNIAFIERILMLEVGLKRPQNETPLSYIKQKELFIDSQ